MMELSPLLSISQDGSQGVSWDAGLSGVQMWKRSLPSSLRLLAEFMTKGPSLCWLWLEADLGI